MIRQIALLGLVLFGCGRNVDPRHRLAFDRAIEETRGALKFPDAAEWPSIDQAHITENRDTVSVMFTVMAKNAFGVQSEEMTLLSFTVDSCAHLQGGFVGDVQLEPDPIDRPCDVMARYEWDNARMEREKAKLDSAFLESKAKLDSLIGDVSDNSK